MIFDRFTVHCIEYQMQIRVCFRFFTTSRETKKRKRQTIWLISLMLVSWVLKVIISSSKTMLWESSRPRSALAFNTEGFSLLISKLDQHDWWEKQGTNRNRQNATTETTQLVISNAWLWSTDSTYWPICVSYVFQGKRVSVRDTGDQRWRGILC